MQTYFKVEKFQKIGFIPVPIRMGMLVYVIIAGITLLSVVGKLFTHILTMKAQLFGENILMESHGKRLKNV